MDKSLVAKVETTIDAPVGTVWKALTTPETIRRYMFGTTVLSDWQEGHPILWKGEWKGRRYEDKGVLLHLEPGRRLTYTHFSPLSGLADRPENYHIVDIELFEQAGVTHLSLSQDNNPDPQTREHSEHNWSEMLDGLKKILEN